MSDQEQSAYAIGYAAQWWAAVVVALVLVGIGGIQAIGPEALDISPITLRWLGIVALCLGAAQAFLPKVQAPPIKDYDEVKAAEAVEKIEAPEFAPEFVDAVAAALLRQRAEDLRQRFPDAPRPGQLDPVRPNPRVVPHG